MARNPTAIVAPLKSQSNCRSSSPRPNDQFVSGHGFSRVPHSSPLLACVGQANSSLCAPVSSSRWQPGLGVQARRPLLTVTPLNDVILSGAPQARSRRTCFHSLPKETLPPVTAQILPCGVLTFDQGNLLGPYPSLQLLFTSDSQFRRAITLEPNQPIATKCRCESLRIACTMLHDPTENIATDSHAKCA